MACCLGRWKRTLRKIAWVEPACILNCVGFKSNKIVLVSYKKV
uniref:Uncharacterized protein n=1 Tax=Arundo donax TaxID=35708 RepID=A0A0A8YIK8_ARUDO